MNDVCNHISRSNSRSCTVQKFTTLKFGLGNSVTVYGTDYKKLYCCYEFLTMFLDMNNKINDHNLLL